MSPPLHRIEVEPEPEPTIAQGGEHRIKIYDRGSENYSVVRLHLAELRNLHQIIGDYLEDL